MSLLQSKWPVVAAVSLLRKGALAMTFLDFLASKTTADLLFLLGGSLAILVLFFLAIVYVFDFNRRKRIARRQEELDIANKRASKTVKTLSPTICEMAKNSVSTECLTDLYRSALGSPTNQDEQLSSFTSEALKALSASLKPKG